MGTFGELDENTFRTTRMKNPLFLKIKKKQIKPLQVFLD
jgi:hypothetical protein